MEDFLTLVLKQIHDGTLIKSADYSSRKCDVALDARDDDPSFREAWSNLSDEVESRWKTSEFDETTRDQIEEIRRASFLTVSRATGQHEIACYVSDDFELMVRGRLLGLSDPMLDWLWESYSRGEFPGSVLSGG